MAILIESLTPEVERAGLTKIQLQTDVELRLRQSGIRVLTDQERLTVAAQPWLYINITVIFNQRLGLTVYDIYVGLFQTVSLRTASEASAIASTWSTGATGTFDLRDVSRIREQVRDLVDEFINAYLSVNPRETGSPAPAPARWYDILPEKPPPAAPAPAPAPQPARRTR